ncbi:MAG: epoxide hydrolase N-terminal domain-containing protein, partial [Candidatus Acidiferrales bacterium]
MSNNDSSEAINHDRRRFVGTAAMSIAAAKFGMMSSANVPSKLTTPPGSTPVTENRPADSGDIAIRPFHISVPEQEIVELRRRVAATRWPERELVSDATQGVQLATTQKLARYWATEHDWRKCEARLKA